MSPIKSGHLSLEQQIKQDGRKTACFRTNDSAPDMKEVDADMPLPMDDHYRRDTIGQSNESKYDPDLAWHDSGKSPTQIFAVPKDVQKE